MMRLSAAHCSLLSNPTVSRRGFVSGVAAAALTSSASSSRPAFAQSPKRGGHVKAAFNQSTLKESLDPIRGTTSLDDARLVQLYDTLVVSSTEMTPAPRLAESWEASADATTWRFKLRRGVEFHNGKSLTSKDVVYTLQRHMGGGKSASIVSVYFDDVRALSADDDYTIRIELNRPNADFPSYLSDPRTAIISEGAIDFAKPVGTGPFQLVSFNPGVSSVMARYSNYWQTGKPYIESLEEIGIDDAIARTNALLSQEIHVAEQADPKTVDKINSSGRATVVQTKSGKHYYFAAMCDRDPTKSLDLRLALKYLIDRKRMLRTVSKGLGQVGNDHPVPPSNYWYCNEIPLREYDPERAKFHLGKAGISKLVLQLHTSQAGSPVADDASLLYQQMVAAANTGLTLDVVREPVDGYWTNIWQKRPFVASGWSPRPTLDLAFTHWFSCSSKWNDTGWCNEAFEKMLLESRATLDEAKRKQLYWEMQRLIHDDAGNIIPVFEDLLDGISVSVKGFIPHPVGALSNWHFAESIWLET